MKLLVYVAGPMSKGGLLENVRIAMREANRLVDAGYAVALPHLSVYWDIVHPRSYEAWMDLDLCTIEHCDALVRLPGESPGADREVAHARAHGVPVSLGVDEFLAGVA